MVVKKMKALFQIIMQIGSLVIPLISLDLSPLSNRKNLIAQPKFWSVPFLNMNPKALNPWLLLNFKNFHKAKFNLEFNETIVIGVFT